MEVIKRTVYKCASTELNIFDTFMEEVRLAHEGEAHSIREMKDRTNTKMRGDLFEFFCVRYLLIVRKMDNCWLLKDIPDDILSKLKLTRRDIGIDIVAEKDGKYYAVQCKYKKRTQYKSTTYVSWKSLSTFYSISYRSGPYEKYIVMTNCSGVSRKGTKDPKDKTIALKSFQNITKEQWYDIADMKYRTISDNIVVSNSSNITVVSNPKTVDALREARLKRFAIAK